MSFKSYIKNNVIILKLINLVEVRIHGKRGVEVKCNGTTKNICINNHGENNYIYIGSGTHLFNCRFNIFGNNAKVVIGNECYLKDIEFWIEDNDGIIKIYDKTKMTGQAQLSSIEGCSITIGESCLFSSNIFIRTGDSHSIFDLNHTRINSSKSVHIGNHVWIGQSASILKGVYLADNTVVGTGAVVTKSFNEGHIIVAGNPAKRVKTNIDWTYER